MTHMRAAAPEKKKVTRTLDITIRGTRYRIVSPVGLPVIDEKLPPKKRQEAERKRLGTIYAILDSRRLHVLEVTADGKEKALTSKKDIEKFKDDFVAHYLAQADLKLDNRKGVVVGRQPPKEAEQRKPLPQRKPEAEVRKAAPKEAEQRKPQPMRESEAAVRITPPPRLEEREPPPKIEPELQVRRPPPSKLAEEAPAEKPGRREAPPEKKAESPAPKEAPSRKKAEPVARKPQPKKPTVTAVKAPPRRKPEAVARRPPPRKKAEPPPTPAKLSPYPTFEVLREIRPEKVPERVEREAPLKERHTYGIVIAGNVYEVNTRITPSELGRYKAGKRRLAILARDTSATVIAKGKTRITARRGKRISMQNFQLTADILTRIYGFRMAVSEITKEGGRTRLRRL